MIKICSQSLILPLTTIFEHSFEKGKFPEIWKKANVFPVHKNFLFFEKSFKDICIIPFSTIVKVIGFSHLPSLVFFQEIHVLPNYYQ